MSTHKHMCADPECSRVWRHPDHMAGNDEAHRCPSCGVTQRFHYEGPLEPGETQASLAALEPMAIHFRQQLAGLI